MHMTSRLTRVAAIAAALFVTTSAFAEGTFTPELGWGRISGGRVYHDGDERREAPSIDAAFGYRWDNGLGVRAMWIGGLNIGRDIFPNDTVRSFDEFTGVQATGRLPLASQLFLNGGLGLGRTSLNRGTPGDHVQTTEGVVSAGLQYQPFTHFALELHFDYLTSTHERNLTLTAQVPF